MKLIHGDCLVEMKNIPDKGVNLVITSPPYNVDLGNNKYKKEGYKGYNDNLPYPKYLEFMRDTLTLCYSLLTEDGRIAINVGDGKNGAITTHSDIIQMAKDVGFLPITTIVWNKNNTSNRCAWGSYLSAKSPSFPRGFEYILVFSKSKSLTRQGESTISKKEWIEYTNGLWTFAPEKDQKKIGHPAMFPVELPKRLIKMLSYKGDVIMDPFMGTGTTGVACVNTNRNFIGIELNEEYFKIAERRINEAIVEKESKLF